MDKTIVLSGANLFTGGTLKVFQELLEAIHENGYDLKYHIIAFVNRKSLFSDVNGNIEYIEIPDLRNNPLKRIYYENFHYYKWSKKREIYIWISMHDLTQRVKAKYNYTYFQSAQLFYKMPSKLIHLDKKEFIRSIAYKYFVGHNIKRTKAVIVQAEWIKEKIQKMYKEVNVIVSKPVQGKIEKKVIEQVRDTENDKFIVIYPSFPRIFKNYETLCDASRSLSMKRDDFEVHLTIAGTENPYAKWLFETYKDVGLIKWDGLIPSKEMDNYYAKADLMVFISNLETWGLPITEFEQYGKPMILADKPYAHESSHGYANKCYVNTEDSKALEEMIEKALDSGNSASIFSTRDEEVDDSKDICSDWRELLEKIIV